MAEAKHISLPRKARPRRSQAERTAETRGRIIAAVVETIADVGIARATAAEITRRAGVTWGAVQHHFGDKDGVLVAVLEESFNRFAQRLEDVPVDRTSLEKRASLLVDRAWEHFASPLHRSAFEILLHYRGRADPREDPTWEERIVRAWDRIWMRLFGSAPIARRHHLVLQHYTIAVLSGLASTWMLEGSQGRLRGSELDLLKQTLSRDLTRRA